MIKSELLKTTASGLVLNANLQYKGSSGRSGTFESSTMKSSSGTVRSG